MKKISICVTTYNQADTVRDTLEGILLQRLDIPYEIVISDDCSQDNSRAVIAEYKSRYPGVFRDVSPTRNLGSPGNTFHVLAAAEGDYIAVCQGDDYWTDPDKLKKQVDFLASHPDYSMCFHRARVRNDEGLPSVAVCDQVAADREYTSDEIYSSWIIQTATIVFRRDVLRRISRLKRPQDIWYDDIPVFLACADTGRVWGMSSVMSVYRISSKGLTHTPSFNANRYVRAIAHDRCLRHNFPKLSRRLTGRVISPYCYTLARTSSGVWDKIRYAVMSLYYSPSYIFGKIWVKLKRIKME